MTNNHERIEFDGVLVCIGCKYDASVHERLHEHEWGFHNIEYVNTQQPYAVVEYRCACEESSYGYGRIRHTRPPAISNPGPQRVEAQ